MRAVALCGLRQRYPHCICISFWWAGRRTKKRLKMHRNGHEVKMQNGSKETEFRKPGLAARGTMFCVLIAFCAKASNHSHVNPRRSSGQARDGTVLVATLGKGYFGQWLRRGKVRVT